MNDDADRWYSRSVSERTFHTELLQRADRAPVLRRHPFRLGFGRGRSAQSASFSDESVTLGSHPANGFCVAHPTVSRFHARITLDATGWLLTDLDSRNGTFIGRTRVRAGYLEPGVSFTLGSADIAFALDRQLTDLPISDAERCGSLLGRSPAMRRLFEQLPQIAASDSTVLIQGETGTGKDLVAQEIHRHSSRRDKPLVVVDCGGLPETLIEAELFGHERGAFTGADRARAGAFEEADGGTLFLDEIGELPLALQVKLLRALETRTVKRLGANDWRRVDVRVIAATHRDVALLCSQRLFREDLYFRLAVLVLRLPPLRERTEDLVLLVHGILDELGAAGSLVLDEPLLAALRARRWAGNVRELRNLIERALVLGPAAFGDTDAPSLGEHPSAADSFKIAKARAIEEFEKQFLQDLLGRHHGNVAQAARAADVDPAWIFRLVKRHGIDLQSLRGRS